MLMNSKIEKDLKCSPGKGNALRPKSGKRTILRMAFLILLFVPMLAASAFGYDFEGTVESVSEPNGLVVNVTEPGTLGLVARVEVLLDSPLQYLSYFEERELQFNILGHDILGRPVCDAYLDGINIRDAYYCRMNSARCSYYRGYLASKLGRGYLYSPCCARCGQYYP